MLYLIELTALDRAVRRCQALSDAVRRCQTLSDPHSYIENALRVLHTAQAWHAPSTEHNLKKPLLPLKWRLLPSPGVTQAFVQF